MRHRNASPLVFALVAPLLLTEVAQAYYTPGLGRFINRDPYYELGSYVSREAAGWSEPERHFVVSNNRYEFALNNPLGWIDADGMAAQESQPGSQPVRPRPKGPAGDPPEGVVCWVSNAAKKVTCRLGNEEVSCNTVSPTEPDYKKENGPTPPNEYLIDTKRTHPQHGCDWYNLCPLNAGKTGYTPYNRKDQHGRSTMGLHPGTVSMGCVTVDKDCWEKLKNLIEKGRLTYKDQKLKGTVIVEPPPAPPSPGGGGG